MPPAVPRGGADGLLVPWVIFPVALSALAIGCGFAAETLAGRRLPGALLPAAGLAVIIVVASWLTAADATAELAVPGVVAIAAVGLASALRRRRRLRAWRWPALAGLAAFASYAAPIVLSGEATFAGYIRLDDTATWMALIDRVMEHGRSVDGLAPSTYEATLAFNLADGYPVGSLLPLGVGRELVGTDVAWLIQPYMAWLGATLALALWTLAGAVVDSRAMRTAIAVVAAQAALLYGYYLWGGVKEVAVAALVATAAAVIPAPTRTVRENVRGPNVIPDSWGRAWLPVALVGAALVSAVSAGGVIWLAGSFGALTAVTAARWGCGRILPTVSGTAAAIGVLSLPTLLGGGFLPPTSSPLTADDARGNLIDPLDPAQIAGIWPAGDFRLDPAAEPITYALIALTLAAAIGGIGIALRHRSWAPLAYAVGSLCTAGVIHALGSPWVDAKALAIASPAILLAAGLGAAGLLAGPRRWAGSAVLVALAAGVLWSNALAYRDASLAPRDQLVELERIGPMIAGEGPTLLTEYQPYGARHFLRAADPEAASELRRRRIALVGGATLEKGESTDTDRIAPTALAAYRTLVVRRSPTQSRPPSIYRLAWSGRYYEVWQRPAFSEGLAPRIALGDLSTPLARPMCRRVAALGRAAGARGQLVAARRPGPIVAAAERLEHPSGWSLPGTHRRLLPEGAGAVAATIRLPASGAYSVWLRGSVRSTAALRIDGQPTAQVRHRLNNDGQYVELGTAMLAGGPHRFEVRLGGPELHPGGGGPPGAIGPLVLSRADPAESRLVRVPSRRAGRLCGQRWDWIEAAPRP